MRRWTIDSGIVDIDTRIVTSDHSELSQTEQSRSAPQLLGPTGLPPSNLAPNDIVCFGRLPPPDTLNPTGCITCGPTGDTGQCYFNTLARIGIQVCHDTVADTLLITVPDNQVVINIDRAINAVQAGGSQLPGGSWELFIEGIYSEVAQPIADNSQSLFGVTILILVFYVFLLFITAVLVLVLVEVISWLGVLLLLVTGIVLGAIAVFIVFTAASNLATEATTIIEDRLDDVVDQFLCGVNAAICCYSGGSCCCGSVPSTCNNPP